MTIEELKALLPKMGARKKTIRARNEKGRLGTLFLTAPKTNEMDGKVLLVWNDNGEERTLYQYGFRTNGRVLIEQQRLADRGIIMALVPINQNLEGWDDDPFELDRQEHNVFTP